MTSSPHAIHLSHARLQEETGIRKRGWVQALERAGTKNNRFIILNRETYFLLHRRYTPRHLGDHLAAILQPIADLCDRLLGTHPSHHLPFLLSSQDASKPISRIAFGRL